MSLAALKKKKGGATSTQPEGGAKKKAKDDETTGVVNEELKALEAHIMKVSRAGMFESLYLSSLIYV